MIKLAASLILAENGVVKASNGNGDTAANRCGGVTYISNMTDAVLESHALSLAEDARVVTGKATLDDELMVKSSYNHSLLVPMLMWATIVVSPWMPPRPTHRCSVMSFC